MPFRNSFTGLRITNIFLALLRLPQMTPHFKARCTFKSKPDIFRTDLATNRLIFRDYLPHTWLHIKVIQGNKNNTKQLLSPFSFKPYNRYLIYAIPGFKWGHGRSEGNKNWPACRARIPSFQMCLAHRCVITQRGCCRSGSSEVTRGKYWGCCVCPPVSWTLRRRSFRIHPFPATQKNLGFSFIGTHVCYQMMFRKQTYLQRRTVRHIRDYSV